MLNFNAGELAKGAKERLEKMGVNTDAAKNVLEGLQNTEAASEQVMSVLRNLLNEAKKVAAKQNNEKLDACIRKAEALLEKGDSSIDAVTKLTAELTALMKGSAAEDGAAKASGAKSAGFTDVSTDAYYYDAVQWAVGKGITSGTSETTFSPDQTCTRTQAIVFLWRAEGSPAPKSGSAFSDVADTAFYRDAALWAAQRGIVTGDAFQPDAPVTRAQMAAFLYRNAGSPAVSGGANFSDVAADAYYAQPVAWVAEKGITSGVGENTFDPDGTCTRAQIVTFLYRAKK